MSAAWRQSQLIRNLCTTLQNLYGVERVRILETHISYILLTGQYAYKIKKAVKFDFLDFSTLELRHHYCLEELRLNRRCAPLLYLDVVAIGGSVERPTVDGAGPAIEYAVKMREFQQTESVRQLLVRGELSSSDIDILATKLAAFHRSSAKATLASGCGTPKVILQRARDNFSALRTLCKTALGRADLARLEQWTEREFAAELTTFVQRRIDGFIRECHGDLHLDNIARFNGDLTFFDGIEFSEELRWIDVMSELAFLVMDLSVHGRGDFAYRLLNRYLEISGDYAGLAILRFYVVYRALVRAKIALLRRSECEESAAKPWLNEFRRYVDVATQWTQPASGRVVLMHGLSGSGKSVVSQYLLERMPAVRLRSDVERKRLAGFAAGTRSGAGVGAGVGAGLYTKDFSELTYQRLLTLTRSLVRAGHSVIVDATFLLREQRRLFSDWASAHDIPLAILSLVAPAAILRERIVRRALEGSDVSEANLAVLDHQLEMQEGIASDEFASIVSFDASEPIDEVSLASLGRALTERLESGHADSLDRSTRIEI